MPVNLSVKNVPDARVERLRARAQCNRRSLQRERLSLLEAAAQQRSAAPLPDGGASTLTVEEVAQQAPQLFARGTQRSVAHIRALRDGR